MVRPPHQPLAGCARDSGAGAYRDPMAGQSRSEQARDLTCPVFCVCVLQVGVDSVGVGGGGAGPGPLYLVGGDLSFDGSGLGLALGWWQSFVLVAFSGSFVHGCRRSPAFASSGHRLIERGRSRGSSVILAQLVARSLDTLVERGYLPRSGGEMTRLSIGR